MTSSRLPSPDSGAEAATTGDAVCDEPITKTVAEWGRELLAAERLVRERAARAIEAERDRLRVDKYPADAQWLRALDSAAAIARDENR